MDEGGPLPEDSRNAFGQLRSAVDAAAGLEAAAVRQGAMNLVDKAYCAVEGGDRIKAESLLRRALNLPTLLDETQPGRYAVHMIVFGEITDALESEEPLGQVWLTCARAIFDAGDDVVRGEIARCLVAIKTDYELSRSEQREVDALLALADDPGDPTKQDFLRQPLSVAQLLHVLAAASSYVTMIAEHIDVQD